MLARQKRLESDFPWDSNHAPNFGRSLIQKQLYEEMRPLYQRSYRPNSTRKNIPILTNVFIVNYDFEWYEFLFWNRCFTLIYKYTMNIKLSKEINLIWTLFFFQFTFNFTIFYWYVTFQAISLELTE